MLSHIILTIVQNKTFTHFTLNKHRVHRNKIKMATVFVDNEAAVFVSGHFSTDGVVLLGHVPHLKFVQRHSVTMHD